MNTKNMNIETKFLRLMLLLLLMMGMNGAWAEDAVLYERTAGNWGNGDLAEWIGSPAGTGITVEGGNLNTSGGNASYGYKKTLDVNPNSTLLITATWNTGSSTGRSGGYNYLSFGNIELRAYGQDSRGVIVIGNDEQELTTTTNDVRNNAEWAITLNVNQVTGNVTYDVVLPNAGTVQGTSSIGEMAFSSIEIGYYKAGQVYNTNQILKAVKVQETLYNYTIKKSVNGVETVIATGKDGPGATITYPYRHYELVGSTLYEAGRQSNPYFQKSFTLDSDGKVETLTYDTSTKSNVLVYREAEDFLTPVTTNNYFNIRCSDTKAGYSSDFVDAAQLNPGCYTITMATYDNHRETFTFNADDTQLWQQQGTSGWGEQTSSAVQVPTGKNNLRVKGGNYNYALDYFYVTANFAFYPQTGALAYGNTENISPKLVNTHPVGSGYQIRYLSDNTGVAYVSSLDNSKNGIITARHNGTATIRAVYLTDTEAGKFDYAFQNAPWALGSSFTPTYYATYTMTVTGEPIKSGTFSYDDGTKTETYTVPTPDATQCALPQTEQASTNSTISISFGHPDESQYVEDVNGKWAVKCIDTNNATQALVNGGVPFMGTYYTFVPSKNGTLKIHAFLNAENNIRLVDAEGNILEKILVGSGPNEAVANTWKDYTFNTLLTSGATYYVYAETSYMGSSYNNLAALFLHSFTFTQMAGVTISLIDQSLLFYPDANAENHRLDRTIPGFELAFTGANGILYHGSEFQMKNGEVGTEAQNGCITITPRTTDTNFKITGVSLNVGRVEGSPQVSINGSGALTFITANSNINVTGLNSRNLTIQLKGTSSEMFQLNSITFTYTPENADLDMSKGQTSLKFANEDFVYGYTGEKKVNDLYFDSPVAFYGDISVWGSGGTGFGEGLDGVRTRHKNADDKVHFNDGDTENPYKVLIGEGVCHLHAWFPETEYFAGSGTSTRLYSRDYTEEPSQTLANGESYVVPAGNGMAFELTATGGGNLTLSGVEQTTIAADGVAHLTTATTAADNKVTITNNSGSSIEITKIDVYRKEGQLSFSYQNLVGADKDVMFFGETYTPTAFTVMSGTDDWSDFYETTGTYSLPNPLSGVSINPATGVITIAEDATQDYLDVMLTVNPKEEYKAHYAPISTKICLKVLIGMWDFRTYNQANHRTMYNSSNAGGTEWGGTYGGYASARDNAEFEYVYRNDDKPLPQAFGLQTRCHHRLLWSKGNDGGNLHLFGKGVGRNESPNGGGEVRVPVKPGMLIEVNARADDYLSEMEMQGVTTLEGDDVTYFYVNDGAPESQYFLATGDYFVIKNPSHNLYLFISYIKVSAEMAFRYGNDTYVDAQAGVFTNDVMNKGETTITYTYTNTKNTPVSDFNTATGEATFGSGAYGIYEVTATGSGAGLLNGKTNTYTATVIGLDVSSYSENISASGIKTDDLKNRLTVNVGNIFDDGIGATAAEAEIKNKVKFTVLNPSPDITLSGSMLTIEGARTVRIKATLGAIEKTFTYTITGGSLNEMNPVIANDATSYTIEIVGVEGLTKDYTFNVQQMYADIRGDIYGSRGSLVFKKDGGEEISNPATANAVVSQTLTIEGFNKKGGVIPIYASYAFKTSSDPETWEHHDLEGTLTVAYSSHVWRFQHNLIQGMDATAMADERIACPTTPAEDLPNDYGTTHHLLDGLRDWVPRTGEWSAAGSSVTIDEPRDGGTHATNRHWGMVRKIKGHTDVSMVYFYNHPCEGENALIIPETEGLHIYSSSADEQMGVEMATYGANDSEVKAGTKNVGDVKLINGNYRCANLMILRGGRLIIPKVKPGQWIEVRWTRHKEDMAERLSIQNLVDVDGNYINKTYKIGNCFYNIPGQTSTYMFQVPQAGTSKGDGTFVTLDEDGCLDAIFTVDDNIYISIQQIELHEPGWEFNSSMAQHLRGKIDGGDGVDIAYQYMCDGEPHTIEFSPKDSQNAPNAPQVWSIEFDPTLENAGATKSDGGIASASITYPADAYGKAYVTLTSYSQNMRYVANRNTWVITFGKKPGRTYPYTWDFTKYRANTKTKVGSSTVGFPSADKYDNYYDEDPLYSATNPTGAHEYRTSIDTWEQNGNNEKALTTDYDTRKYWSYFVNGAQLVSRGLSTSGGVLPETEGLGFSLNNLTDNDKTNDATLTLNMENTVTGNAAKAQSGNTWRSGKLTITGGGSITVPTPGTAFNEYYIYIRSSVKPSSVTNTEESAVYVNGTNQWRYHFTANADAVITFSGDADVYAIGVTNIFKPLTKVGSVGWATESRKHTVDHALTGYFTTNPVGAYAIIQRTNNPVYTDNTANVSITDQRYVVPGNTGLVLKQTESLPTLSEGVTTYNVPFFVPAVTTDEDAAEDFAGNLMRPNPKLLEDMETRFYLETENTNAIDGVSRLYYRFILAKRYMTWTAVQKEGEARTVTPPTQFESREVAAFYRMHTYSNVTGVDTGGEDVDQLNTLGVNKAYLILPADKVPDALWKDQAAPAKPRYVGIVGESDMADDLIDLITDPLQPEEDVIYNLKGQRLNPNDPLPTGIYIRNRQKVFIKP